jgi:hypothetical protein
VAPQPIAAGAAEERVRSAAAGEPIVARTALKHDGGRAGGDLVGGRPADDHLDVGHDVVALTGRAVVRDALECDDVRPDGVVVGEPIGRVELVGLGIRDDLAGLWRSRAAVVGVRARIVDEDVRPLCRTDVGVVALLAEVGRAEDPVGARVDRVVPGTA